MKRWMTTVLVALGVGAAAEAGNWPAWRGPEGTGISSEKGLPLKWSATQNVRWKTAMPGPGNSTPIVWGKRMFVTCALEGGKKRAVMCLDRETGKELWRRAIEYTEKETTHATNPYCSQSPVTDGERVIAWHGSAGVVCYNFEGRELWRRDLGRFEHVWGNASSPVLYGDLLILNCGPGERQFVIAMEKRTGKTVWQVDVPGGKFGENQKSSEWIGSWSTPVVAKAAGRDELLVSLPESVRAFDPRTGKDLWRCAGLGKLIYTSVVPGDGVAVAMSGYHMAALAVKIGGNGDVTAKHRLWLVAPAPQRVGSGVIVGDYFYILNEPGVAMCMEVKTGKTIWQERASGMSWSSMVAADGRLYAVDRKGETVVLRASPKFEVLAKNALNEATQASLAVSDGEIFIRTHENLYCISERRLAMKDER